jgi:hypothetical protein
VRIAGEQWHSDNVFQLQHNRAGMKESLNATFRRCVG